MQKYQFFKKGTFESLAKFEKRLNEMADSGWQAVTTTSDNGQMVVLLERVKR